MHHLPPWWVMAEGILGINQGISAKNQPLAIKHCPTASSESLNTRERVSEIPWSSGLDINDWRHCLTSSSNSPGWASDFSQKQLRCASNGKEDESRKYFFRWKKCVRKLLMVTSITDRQCGKRSRLIQDIRMQKLGFDPDWLLFHESFRGDRGKIWEWTCLGIGPFRMGARVLIRLSGWDGLTVYEE